MKRRKFFAVLLASCSSWLVRKAAAFTGPGPLRAFIPTMESFVRPPIHTQGGEVPLVRIDLIEGKSETYRTQVSECVYQTLVDVLSVPEHDRFHVLTEHAKSSQIFDRNYLGIHRSDECIFIQITLNNGRSAELKQRFYRALADRLHQEVRLRKEDVLINLVEVPRENWSFGNGDAQYVAPK